jgi:5-methylthioadenosine/S-adenosylhomocysteine deaminase
MTDNISNKNLIAVDTMIEARWIATVCDDAPLLENVSVIVKDAVILDILPTTQARLKYAANSIVGLDEHILIPGLINLHTHAAMSLMRGIADDKPLMTWLNDYIWPSERAVVNSRYVYEASLLACAEMLSGGITCFNDMYFYPKATADAVTKAGIRASLGLVVLDFPTNYANDPADYLHKGFDAYDAWRNNELISTCLAPHAPYTVSNHTFETVLTYADQLNLNIHTHLHETHDELNESIKQYGVRPIKRLFDLGLISSNLIVAHAVHCTDHEIDLLAEYGVNIAHCPTSNLKLGSGIAPVAKMLNQSINIGLGTDGVASNNRLDMFAEMRLAALLVKGVNQDPSLLPASEVLKMATINAAKSLGLAKQIGSIELGKQADFAAVKLSDFTVSPCYDPISHLVYVCGREHVTHTWVAGNLRYNVGEFASIEPLELKEILYTWQPKLSQIKQ